MTVQRSRVLVSYQINVQTSAIEIECEDKVVMDGEVLSIKPHRGVYELINGDLPAYIQDEFGISLASLTSETVMAFTKANSDLRGALAALEVQCNEINVDRERLVARIGQLTTERDALLEDLYKKETEIQELNVRVQASEKTPVAVEIVRE